jgi:hypothetical protein
MTWLELTFFGPGASVNWRKRKLQECLGHRYKHHDLDVRHSKAFESLFRRYSAAIELIIHAARTAVARLGCSGSKGRFRDKRRGYAQPALTWLGIIRFVRRYLGCPIKM